MAKIKIKNAAGEIVAEFSANFSEKISEQAIAAGAEIPAACGVGACGLCRATVECGLEFVYRENFGDAHTELAENEILTCVAGVKKSAPENAEIILICENL